MQFNGTNIDEIVAWLGAERVSFAKGVITIDGGSSSAVIVPPTFYIVEVDATGVISAVDPATYATDYTDDAGTAAHRNVLAGQSHQYTGPSELDDIVAWLGESVVKYERGRLTVADKEIPLNDYIIKFTGSGKIEREPEISYATNYTEV